MNRLTVSMRLWLALALMWICLLIICAWGALQTRQNLLDERQSGLKNVTDSAISLVKKYADAADKGKLSKADAQREAIAQLRVVRFSENSYLGVTDTHENVIMHPIKPELDGTNQSSVKDPKGQFVFQEISRLGRAGGGYMSYLWPKPGSEQPVAKVTRVGYFAPWDWCVAAGLYTDDVDKAFRRALVRWCVLLFTIGGVISVAMLQIIRKIKSSLGGEPGYAIEIAGAISNGDLAVTVKTRSGDSHSLLAAIRRMQESLSSTVSRIREGAESISSAARQIAAGNSDLSARTESQAASLQETAASMAQLTQTVKQNTDNARQANTLATTAADMAGAGNDAVQGMVATIGKISQSSVAITEITGLIEGIAFQTNILALNAAVEAARAGEHGRGFAVVASEVRGLAQRASTAAKEIKDLIESSVTLVGDSSKQAEEVGAAIEKVKQSIRQVSDIVGEIMAASEEQSRGIEQVNEAVHQMDEMTQQNAALVEQAAASAQSMQEQAGSLVRAVSVFRLESGKLVSTAHEANQARSSSVLRGSASTPSKAIEMDSRRSGAQPGSVTSPARPKGMWEQF
ncbi:cache domain-containing protein [Cupriavidus necator]|uniref:Methyl-accepting transducer domain-containing protein n=1 Tax=Cupriavidus necator TaxID=106590 RepID=A0A367PGX6_CUPNE|nr:methyl-accepting chemotaxis protein [Cupriavidus necator]QQX86595.1 cache domain-containing protein [Cupriavidus necator]RCJ06793.1 hypothetical protein DDK22_19250 [Cupriavidus necator]